ncbi:MAG: bifunctional folylpolyglutamate synthase/dihydrofolate synthase [Acidobacteriaceae bacterium]|nr:bifunctional folylpolyglutamate synthase/dihydrofolate synthase [Acidobacteriaceae bacterium]MBV9779096.1 bifunctional folylpolyglutamate synthase/dihydrofolate synthase [Acidobacteriaceae bacterium]
MSYLDSVRYLYALGNELRPGAKFGLERMQKVLDGLENPERGQRFIHVAGTNGKGSTCAMIANALRHAGYCTGLYTSPHLVEPTERIQIDGQPLTQQEFIRAFETVHAAAERLMEQGRLDAHPSYFETVTAMALVTFREKCDVAVLEVGLGGRLDATNVINPELCVITSISFDHESYLGNSVESIAAEKAGILKPGTPVVLARQPAQAEGVISERAHQVGSKIVRAADAPVSIVSATAHGAKFMVDGVPYECGLAGRHQVENATAAILACCEWGVEKRHIQAGVKDVTWPGRLELISRTPDFILDGAHNPAGAAALGAYIREFCSERPVWIVFGSMRDKAVEEMTGEIFPLADRVIVTKPNFPRALRPEAILAVAEHPDARIAQTIEEAIEMARSAPPDAAIFFTGSLFLVGEARGLLM